MSVRQVNSVCAASSGNVVDVRDQVVVAGGDQWRAEQVEGLYRFAHAAQSYYPSSTMESDTASSDKRVETTAAFACAERGSIVESDCGTRRVLFVITS
jgi:hypothetical protein